LSDSLKLVEFKKKTIFENAAFSFARGNLIFQDLFYDSICLFFS